MPNQLVVESSAYPQLPDDGMRSGNRLAAKQLLKFVRFKDRAGWAVKDVTTLEMTSGLLGQISLATSASLMPFDLLLGPMPGISVVIATTGQVPFGESANSVDCRGGIKQLDQIHRRFPPKKVIHLRTEEDFDDQLPTVLRSVLRDEFSREGQTTVSICQKGVSGPPISSVWDAGVALEQVVN